MSGVDNTVLSKAVSPTFAYPADTPFFPGWRNIRGSACRPGLSVFTSSSSASRRSSCGHRRSADALATSAPAPSLNARAPSHDRFSRGALPPPGEPWRHSRDGRRLCCASLSASLAPVANLHANVPVSWDLGGCYPTHGNAFPLGQFLFNYLEFLHLLEM